MPRIRKRGAAILVAFVVLQQSQSWSWSPAALPHRRPAPSKALHRGGSNCNPLGAADAGGDGDAEEVRRVQANIRQAFQDSLESSPDLVVPEGFVLHRDKPEPSADELTNTNMLRIILSMCEDEEVNELVWKCLGYRWKAETDEWDASECFPKWRERFPTPPDLVGVTRIYSKEIDGPVLKANQALVRTVPMKYKQSIREQLRPEGFNGFKLAELTPNKTRRAQCANWLLYFREALFGVSLEELQRRKAEDVEAENFRLRMEGKSAKIARPDGKTAEQVLAERQEQEQQ